MLAIARALMAEPRLLLLDEPSLGLAPQMAERIIAAITALNRAGTAVLLVEQDAHLALAVAQRAYVLETGCIAAAGPAAVLADDPALRRAYLGEDPV
jgi:branched-chain amino acid transport system ATP-binding protein